MAAIKIMMSRMITQRQMHADERQQQFHKEFEGRHESDMKLVITFAMFQHVQSLNAVIVHERIARTQAISEIQTQIQGLHAEFQAFTATTAQMPLREDRNDEVVIGGFGMKSKERRINVIENIIMIKDDDPQILKENMNLHSKTFMIPYWKD